MEKYKYDESNGLWYELQGDYYIPCLKLPEEEQQPIGVWGQRHLKYLRENKRVLLSGLQLNCHSARFSSLGRTEGLFPRLKTPMKRSSPTKTNC